MINHVHLIAQRTFSSVTINTNLVQFPGRFSRTHNVIAALNDSCRNMLNFAKMVEDMSVAVEKPTVYKVMSATYTSASVNTPPSFS